MPICRKCKKSIDRLQQVSSGVERCDILFNKKEGYINWENEDFESDGIVREFYCPECNKVLFTDDEQAENFLEETDELQELVAEKINKIQKGG
ncbi:hypothetical protein LCGC14_2308570 [marine sediment metagenome]|uniref:Uncharacterized protein n=1 Tax=marine sediment metagenome TaxID=412755 RepID=A0A0F9CLT8_9ZZZZ